MTSDDSARWSERGLLLILAAFLVIGALYAAFTPPWQVPDEPAHYNYIRTLIEQRSFPVLQAGDYDQAYLAELTATGFPPENSIASLEYEDHQPPLYYLLMTVTYLTFRGSLLALRLASLGLGAGVIVCAFVVARQLFQDQPIFALTAAGFAAFVPQHVAIMAGVSNDSLAGLVAGLTLILLIRYIRPRGSVPKGYTRDTHGGRVGVLIGMGFLTKTTIYFLPFLAALALVWRWRQEAWDLRRGLREAAGMFVPAFVLGALWWGRNLAVYGWPDLFGLQRHGAVVIGQPRTPDWIAQFGLGGVALQLLETTFKSWWGQFGWMGVPMDRWVYLALLVYSLAIGLGLAYWLAAPYPGRELSPFHWRAFGLLALTVLFSLALYLGYNLTFVQHQGRYLFPALIPVALGAAAGLSAWGLLVTRIFKRAFRWLPLLAVALMALLDVFALFRFVVPALARH